VTDVNNTFNKRSKNDASLRYSNDTEFCSRPCMLLDRVFCQRIISTQCVAVECDELYCPALRSLSVAICVIYWYNLYAYDSKEASAWTATAWKR